MMREIPRKDALQAAARKSAAFLLVGLLLAAALAACSSEKPKPAAKTSSVLMAVATSQPVPINIVTFGRAQAIAAVSVKAEVSGNLTKVHFEKGQSLKKGDPLFTIDPRTYRATLEQSKANLTKDQVLLENAQDIARRTDMLFNKSGASREERDQSTADANALAASVRADTAAVESAQLDLDRCTITCPIDGKAGNVLLHEGNYVKTGEAVLVIVNQIRPVDVFFGVPQDKLATIKDCMGKGCLQVRVWLPNEESQAESGELVFVDNAVDPESGTVQLGARFENANERLWPGQYVQVSLTLQTLDNAVVVPNKAVETGRDGKYLFVIAPDNTVAVRAVTAGPRIDDKLVILTGLAAGEKVVTDGQMRLTPGATVVVAADSATPASQPASAPEAQR